MENPFKSWTQKDWLYAGGAVASIVALVAFAASQNKGQVAIPPGAHTDVQTAAGTSPVSYINQNVGDMADVVPVSHGQDTSSDNSGTSKCGGCCDKAGSSMGYCTGPSPLVTGDTFSTVNQLIQYYQNTNPNYIKLQELQMQKYAALFATGQTYSRGGVLIGAAGAL